MPSKVCILAPEHAEALEERNVIPDCRYHNHLSHREADVQIALERDAKSGRTVEGWGTARSVRSMDGRRRITPIPQTEIMRTLNKLLAPPKLHYQIPACGDHRIAWHNSFMSGNDKQVAVQ